MADYYQENYNSVTIIAKKSIFYNDYPRLVHCSANVIVHHAPKEIASEEICSCPNYEFYTSRKDFVLDYKLEFGF
ncbi:MAG: hypothetical protein NY202_05820 [Mollicutes bacterium UO1]